MMKSHAFVREKAGDVLQAPAGTSVQHFFRFKNYVYFQFVPTLVYRDNYPRNKVIRWNFVLKNFGLVAGALAYTYYIFVRFCMPVFRNFNRVRRCADSCLFLFLSVSSKDLCEFFSAGACQFKNVRHVDLWLCFTGISQLTRGLLFFSSRVDERLCRDDSLCSAYNLHDFSSIFLNCLFPHSWLTKVFCRTDFSIVIGGTALRLVTTTERGTLSFMTGCIPTYIRICTE